MSTDRDFLRHTLATLAYRAGKAVRHAPPTFASFTAAPGSRTPAQILAHMGDLFDWALSMARGHQTWKNSTPLAWEAEVARFFETLGRFDAYLASEEPLSAPCGQLFQGPVADALTHTGQLTMLRRIAGSPITGENYAQAEIVAGRVSASQSAPRREFD
jgi:hypothetical protein